MSASTGVPLTQESVAGFLGDRAGGGFAWIFEKAPVDLDKVGRIFGASCEIIRL